eukprot:gnl/MRDRNA2_/MRDRNA2_15292_c0_seq1.p1 gnl/MRDRNA2_/MRDRNA2_15292_c0~~gnl/MRDRNA2_/MRDRNA2_15292_c0_seq1.p1  ORF type:complete len:415 (-),score=107.84 gnl/MRDRNA2_/MRDRNA2_15292_c0_seq1:56-1300(-)
MLLQPLLFLTFSFCLSHVSARRVASRQNRSITYSSIASQPFWNPFKAIDRALEYSMLPPAQKEFLRNEKRRKAAEQAQEKKDNKEFEKRWKEMEKSRAIEAQKARERREAAENMRAYQQALHEYREDKRKKEMKWAEQRRERREIEEEYLESQRHIKELDHRIAMYTPGTKEYIARRAKEDAKEKKLQELKEDQDSLYLNMEMLREDVAKLEADAADQKYSVETFMSQCQKMIEVEMAKGYTQDEAAATLGPRLEARVNETFADLMFDADWAHDELTKWIASLRTFVDASKGSELEVPVERIDSAKKTIHQLRATIDRVKALAPSILLAFSEQYKGVVFENMAYGSLADAVLAKYHDGVDAVFKDAERESGVAQGLPWEDRADDEQDRVVRQVKSTFEVPVGFKDSRARESSKG